MQNGLIPQSLQTSFNQFLQQLEQLEHQLPTSCPYCVSNTFNQTRAEPLTFRCKTCLKYFNPLTATPFNRLTPASWLPIILLGRVQNETYQTLADKLDCSVKMTTHRDKIIKSVMQERFPALYQWYRTHNSVTNQPQINNAPETITKQHLALKQKITKLLTSRQADCLHCQSPYTVKIGQRTAFRCKACRHSFNLLDNTPIRRLRNADKWIKYIDLLAAKQSNHAIATQLGLNSSTMGDWRRMWCSTMQQWGFDALASWCKR